MADYRELGIEIPDPQPVDGTGHQLGIVGEMYVNANILSHFAFNNDWESLKNVLAITQNLEDQALYHASVREPEAMATDQLKIQFKDLLAKLPQNTINRFTAEGQRVDFVEAGVNPDLIKVLFNDSPGYNNPRNQRRQAEFDLSISSVGLDIKNHYSPLQLSFKFGPLNQHNSSPILGIDVHLKPGEQRHSEEQQLEIAREVLKGLGAYRFLGQGEEGLTLHEIGRKYNIASSLIEVTGKMTDSYLAALAPYTQKAG